MNASKFLISTVAAVAVVGTIGFAYAQTGNYSSSAPSPDPQNQTTTSDQTGPATVNPNLQIKPQIDSTDTMNRDSRSNARNAARNNMGNDTGVRSNERLARADRN